MNTIDAILTRRSIRSFKPDSIDREQILTLLRAAMHAPSAIDEQPWRFVVVTDREKLQAIPTVHTHAGLVAGAPLAILVCGDMSRLKVDGYWVQDCSCAAQNILLAAHAAGLGAVWVGVYPTTANVASLSRYFKLPETVLPFALIAIGHPAEECEPKDTFDSGLVHWDSWKNGAEQSS